MWNFLLRRFFHFARGESDMLVDEHINVGNVELAGRIAFPPMATGASTPDGAVTRAVIDHYVQVAANPSVSLVITEHAYVHQSGKASPGQLSVSRDEDVPGLRALAEAVHAARPEIRLFAQISHAGLNTRTAYTGERLLGPTGNGLNSRMLDAEGIREVERWFADAARRVKDAGFDGVEIHAAHGYLLNEFLSPLTNGRQDAYGRQTVENRMRLATETLTAVRTAVGPNFPVAIRLGACDYQAGGTTIEDGAQAALLAEQAGADFIDVSGGMCGPQRRGHREPGYFADASMAVRRAVSVPVLVTGGVRTRDQAEELLECGAADIIGIGRALYRRP